jgi:prephenate dehydrogenase
MEPSGICVVGGGGRMGTLVVRFLREAGYNVTIADSAVGPIDWSHVAEHEVIILTVPLPIMEDVVRQLGPLTREDGAVIDIASLKEEPVQCMLRYCRGEVIGTHPLFGPRTESLKDQLVFVWPARSGVWMSWLRSFLERSGAKVREMEPKAHDRLMAKVQVLRHLLLICFGHGLMRMGFDLAEDLPLSGPWFSNLVQMLARQMDQGSGLYADLALHNPETAEIVDEFLASVIEITDAYRSRDRERMTSEIDRVADYVRAGLPPLPRSGSSSND